MKKRILSIFAISILSLTTFSCSEDDNQNSNPLIGNWYKVDKVGANTLNDCEKQTNYKFTNNVFSFEGYRVDEEGNCNIYLDGSYPYEISKGKLMVDGIEISEDKLIADGTEIYFNVDGNNLTLFFNVEEKYIVEERYVKR